MAANEQHYVLPLPVFHKPVKLLIVVAPYYKDITDNLVAGARAVAASCGAEVDLVEVSSFILLVIIVSAPFLFFLCCVQMMH